MGLLDQRNIYLPKSFLDLLIAVLILINVYFSIFTTRPKDSIVKDLPKSDINLNYDKNDIINRPYLFIGGSGRSGTTLIRAILDVHPEVHCGPETKILPSMLDFISAYNFMTDNANKSSVDTGTALFLHHIMENHLHNTRILCAKDPFILLHTRYLHKILPRSKFIYMIRDGRDAVFSLMKHYNDTRSFKGFKKRLRVWNNLNINLYNQCTEIGDDYCKMVKYEELVNSPEAVIKDIINFLNINWYEELLNHEKFVGNEVAVAKSEWSSDQIKNPIYKVSIGTWKGNIQDYNEAALKKDIKMLKKFGYLK